MRWFQHRSLRKNSVDFPQLWELLFSSPTVLRHDLASQNPYWAFLYLLYVSTIVARRGPHRTSHNRKAFQVLSLRGLLRGFAVCRSKQEKVALLGCCALLAELCLSFGYPWAACGRRALSGSMWWTGCASPVSNQIDSFMLPWAVFP